METKKIPVPVNENERLKALDYYDIMDTAAEERFDNLTQLASEICNTPISLVSLVDGQRQWFKSKYGLDASETPREISFCQHAIMDVDLFEVENALENDLFSDNVLVTGDPNIRFYAGHPLIDDNGFALGTLCVIDSVPKKLDEHQKKALKILASEVALLIQARKQRQELEVFKKFFTMSLDFLCVAGTDGYFKILNPSFTEKLGYSKEELLAKPFADFIHPDDIDATTMEVHKLSKGYKTVGFENRYRKSSGEYIWLHWTAYPDPLTGELFAAAHDITELKKVEQMLLASNTQLDQFAYIVSHDLKAPLRAISTLSTFIEEDMAGQLSGEVSENFKLLKSRVERMEALINGILQYSRIGKDSNQLEEVDVQELVEQVVDSLDNDHDFKIEIPENLPTINFTKTHLTQVFQNLISNAIKYHDKNTGTIQIGYAEENGAHKFSVKDDGPGIESQYHAKIFDIFQTLQSKDKVESTGIGLSIVKKIVEEHGGSIGVKSIIGKGSQFWFTVPK